VQKIMKKRVGELDLTIPGLHQGGFYPSSLEKGLLSRRALKVTLAEMYMQGVATRRVAAITERLCRLKVTSTQVSRAAAELDGVLQKWLIRPLGEMPYLFLSARSEKVRHQGMVLNEAVLMAVGIDKSGKRQILGLSVAVSEMEAHWREFLRQMQQRGLSGVELIISADHAGLRSAHQALLPDVPWQRCQSHLEQNAAAYIFWQDLRKQVADDIRTTFNAQDRIEADRFLKIVVERYKGPAAELARWMEQSLPEGFTVFSFQKEHQRRLRTANIMERLDKEIRRRTRVVRLFPNEASCLRLVSAVLMEISDDWEAERVYLKMI
jgi:putative transposase